MNTQEKIVAHAREAVAPLEIAITRIGQEIDFISEYAFRLASDAVSGKIDVCNADLPDVPLEEVIDNIGVDTAELLDEDDDEEEAA